MTTVKTTLTLDLPVSPTKEQEAAFLAALVIYFAPRQGVYLADLFTQPLLDYVTRQIRADFPPDVFQYLSEAQQSLQQKDRECLEQARRAADAEARVKTLRASFDGSTTELTARIDGLREELATVRRNKYDSDCATLEERNRADKLQAENDRLKIMLFDLEHPTTEEN